MQQVSVNKHSGQFLGHSAQSRKISSNRLTHSEAFAEKPKQIFNVHENIIYQGFKSEFGAIWRLATYQKLDFSFACKFLHS